MQIIKESITHMPEYILYKQGDDISRIAVASKIVERMVNQNTYDDIAQGNTNSHLSAQSDQCLCYSLLGKYHMLTCYR